MQESVLGALRAHARQHVDDLREILRLPSVASQNQGVRECAAWLVDFMRRAGAIPKVIEDAQFPVLIAEVPGQSSRTLLVYGHYDVQPANEPEWQHDPFGAEIVGGRLYGRGAVDDKGPVMAALEAVRTYIELGLRPPVTVRFLLEGEEEIGSPSLRPVLEKHCNLLESDGLVNYDDNVWFDGRPRVVCGIKGGCHLRLEVRTQREFHAMMAPLIDNAVWRLTWALNTLFEPGGRILIEGFYEDVLPAQQQDLDALQDLRWTGQELLAAAGQRSFVGGKTPTDALKAFILEPSINLGGITGGYVDPVRKGVVPNFAAAELRFGTVPNQTAAGVADKVRRHLTSHGFGDVQVRLRGGSPWARTPIDSDLAQALARSLDKAFGRGVAYQPSFAGSGPEGVFQQLFPNMQQAYSGFGPTDDNLHAPNEYIVVDDYLRGIESVARLFHEYAKQE